MSTVILSLTSNLPWSQFGLIGLRVGCAWGAEGASFCAILRVCAQWEPSKTDGYRVSKTIPKLDVAGSIPVSRSILTPH